MVDLVPDGHKSGWLIDNEDQSWIDSLEVGVPFTYGDYQPVQDVLTKPSEWLRIEDQNGFGSCQGHALSTVCEIAYYNASKGDITQLSRWFAYVGTQKIDGIRGDQGSTISGGAELAKRYGICPEELYPYPRSYTYTISQAQYDAAAPFKLKTARRMETVDDVRNWLDGGMGGINIGVRWGGGGHAIAIVETQGSSFKVANSWGTSWGDNGYLTWTEREMSQKLRESYTVAIGLTDMEEIKPREYEWSMFA